MTLHERTEELYTKLMRNPSMGFVPAPIKEVIRDLLGILGALCKKVEALEQSNKNE